MSFSKAIEPHYTDALRYCRALCARWSPSEAEDVLQQAFLQALEHYDRLEDSSKFRAWLFRIITRTFYSSVRRSFWKRFIPLHGTPEVEDLPEVYHRPERRDDALVLMQALSQLSSRQRAAILLYEVAGFSMQEIASIQGDGSVSAVKSRLSRSRRKLKVYLLQAEQGRGVKRLGQLSSQSGDLDHETIKMVVETQHVIS